MTETKEVINSLEQVKSISLPEALYKRLI